MDPKIVKTFYDNSSVLRNAALLQEFLGTLYKLSEYKFELSMDIGCTVQNTS